MDIQYIEVAGEAVNAPWQAVSNEIMEGATNQLTLKEYFLVGQHALNHRYTNSVANWTIARSPFNFEVN